jgi:pimeloyl-ACP methyl ester carboxylesterase
MLVVDGGIGLQYSGAKLFMPIVKSNGIDIAYQERGRGEPLVLIMGLGAPGSVWEEHARAYEKHFRCILVDNRGAGDSEKPLGPYDTRTMAGDVAGVMDALNIGAARVAGISMGSAIAQELALAHPDKVRSLVLISSWARCDIYTKTVFEHFCHVRAAVSPEAFMELLQLWIFTPPHFERNNEGLVVARAEAGRGATMPRHAFEAQCAACTNHDTIDRLGRISAPALLTVGDADIFTPLRLSEEIHRRMPGSQMEVFNGWGHAHHWEDLTRFNRVTTEFLLAH